jgi:hypothetical protein
MNPSDERGCLEVYPELLLDAKGIQFLGRECGFEFVGEILLGKRLSN